MVGCEVSRLRRVSSVSRVSSASRVSSVRKVSRVNRASRLIADISTSSKSTPTHALNDRRTGARRGPGRGISWQDKSVKWVLQECYKSVTRGCARAREKVNPVVLCYVMFSVGGVQMLCYEAP
jgi:hypothetical protein